MVDRAANSPPAFKSWIQNYLTDRKEERKKNEVELVQNETQLSQNHVGVDDVTVAVSASSDKTSFVNATIVGSGPRPTVGLTRPAAFFFLNKNSVEQW